MSPPLLRAEGLAIGYARQGRRGKGQARAEALASGIGFSLGAGSLVALVGPNGAGKSTLLRTLVGMQPALGGAVELCGSPLARLSVEERAQRAASVFTDRFDPGWFTVQDIVAFGRFPYTDLRNRLSAHDRDSIRRAIEAVGLHDFANRRLLELSDGERQKALIARALAQDTPLLVLDEPTAFLDAPARIEIFHLARSIARRGNRGERAVILSTHDVELALRHADQVWLFDREHRFEAGTPESLALAGSVGRAFDGRGVRFDPAAGNFRSTESHVPLSLSLRGAEGLALDWTRRLVDRLGFQLRRAGEAADLSLELVAGDAASSWILRGAAGGESSFASLDDLAESLAAFLAAAGGER